jgi:hypothetical protein
MVLSKADILSGANTYTEYGLKSVDGSINIRPLTIGELHQIQEMKDKALGDYVANQRGASRKRVKETLEAQAKINVGKQTIASHKADVKTVLFGLDNKGNPDTYTEEDIKKMHQPLFEEILSIVKKISHMEDEEIEDDVEDFHQEE